MSDAVEHLDFIRIQGLTSSAAEVFQGLTSGGGAGADAALEMNWGDMPKDAITLIDEYTKDLNSWRSNVFNASGVGGTRGSLVPLPPNIPSIIGTVALGGFSLPAMGMIMIAQVVANLIGSSIQNFVESLDENSLPSIFKKAFLYEERGVSKSIFHKALLYAQTTGDTTTLQSVLNDRLSDLAFVDATIDFGFCRIHIKGKAIEY